MDAEAVPELPLGRHLAVDDRGVGLRATWRLDQGFLNLSLWRGDVCVETFHLTPGGAAELMAFLARGLADATVIATMAAVRPIRPGPPPRRRVAPAVARIERRVRAAVAAGLEAGASRVRPS